MDVTLAVRVAPKDYVAAITAVLGLPAERVNWTNPKTVGKYEPFTHPNI